MGEREGAVAVTGGPKLKLRMLCAGCGRGWTIITYRQTNDKEIFLRIAKRHGWLRCLDCGSENVGEV